jgi:hypothetical protein
MTTAKQRPRQHADYQQTPQFAQEMGWDDNPPPGEPTAMPTDEDVEAERSRLFGTTAA